jgi:hypothetical protein
MHAPLVQFAYEFHEMLDASTEPVAFPDDQGVTFTESFLHFRKSRPHGVTSPDFVVKDLLATG